MTTVTRLRPSAFKRAVARLPLGAKVEIDSVAGTFLLPRENRSPLVFLAGGVGITPFLSMLEALKSRKLRQSVLLLYANRNRARTVFFQELQELAERHRKIKIIFVMSRDSRWSGERGRINEPLLRKYVKDFKTPWFYVCGKPQMTGSLSVILLKLGVPGARIKTEEFTGY